MTSITDRHRCAVDRGQTERVTSKEAWRDFVCTGLPVILRRSEWMIERNCTPIHRSHSSYTTADMGEVQETAQPAKYLAPEVFPAPDYIKGLPTADDLDDSVVLFTWGELKDIIKKSGSDGFSRNKSIEKRYKKWSKDIKEEYGGIGTSDCGSGSDSRQLHDGS